MSIKLKIANMEFEGLTVEEAAKLAATFLNGKSAKVAENKAPAHIAAQPKKRGRPNKIMRTPSATSKPVKNAVDMKPVSTEAARSALGFLTAVQEAGKDGLDSEGVRAAFGVKDTKQIGTKSAMVNRMISEFALRRNSVYTNHRTVEGRFWKAGKNLPVAIEELEKRVSAH